MAERPDFDNPNYDPYQLKGQAEDYIEFLESRLTVMAEAAENYMAVSFADERVPFEEYTAALNRLRAALTADQEGSE